MVKDSNESWNRVLSLNPMVLLKQDLLPGDIRFFLQRLKAQSRIAMDHGGCLRLWAVPENRGHKARAVVFGMEVIPNPSFRTSENKC